MKTRNCKGSIKLILIITIIILIIVGVLVYLFSTSKIKDKKATDQNKIAQMQTVDEKNLKTEDFTITGCSSIMGKVTYEVFIVINDTQYQTLKVSASEFNLPSNLLQFNSDIHFRLKYFPDSLTVYDCKVIDNLSGDVIEDLSEDNINRLYNIEYGKSVIEKEWTEAINLSEIRENEIYEYIATEEVENYPIIENNTGEDCVIYTKKSYQDTYEKDIKMHSEIGASHLSAIYDDIDEGETYRLLYKKISQQDLLNTISEDDIIYLSNYSIGDEVSYTFERYIYNDTNNDINVIASSDSLFDEETTTYTIKANEIVGFNWMTDSLKIEE